MRRAALITVTLLVAAAGLTRPAAVACAGPARGVRGDASPPGPPAPARAIAIAEDRRAWTDGVLTGYLQSADAALRARAALAVGRLQDSTAVPALLRLLRDPEPAVRREAAFALGQIGHTLARIPLEAALTDADPDVVDLAIEALGKLGDKAATPRVLPFLDATAPRLRSEAAVALWRLADSTAAEALLAHLSEPDAGARWRIVYALEKLPGSAARIAPVLAPKLRDSDALVRAHAARTLGRLKAHGVTASLLEALHDDEAPVTVNAIRALQLIADSTTAGQMVVLASLLGHADPYVRVTAALAMGDAFAWQPVGTNTLTARQALVRGLDDRDAATRGACARALVARFGADGLAQARAVLGDSSVYARVALLDGLRQAKPPAFAAPVLAASLAPGRPLLERMTAAEVAGVLGGKSRSPRLLALLPALRAGVADRNLLYAASCAGALGDFGDSVSVPLLVRTFTAHARDADADARISLRDALRQLAGRPFTDSLERAHPAPSAPAVFPAGFETDPRERGAVLHTSAGDIRWAFNTHEAPQTVKNFVRLARRGYFNGLRIHRVVPDFVIQDGDPTGTGSGGPGWTIRCEYNRLRYDEGQVGMALSGKDTGGSQWFITLSPQPHLNGRYTIFAHVTSGLDVARRITQGAVVRKVEILE